jgi:murein DD-endopeptidase MepM/ murein hydrolase activator NlpD
MYVRSRGFGATLTSPIAGDPTISSLFGPRAQPTAGASTNHQGIDYAVPIGTPVLAAGDGTVTFAGVQSGFGNTVVINNGDGTSTLYGHLSTIGVSVGQAVGDGDQIALSGNTGTTSGPNLHFQVMQNGVAVDPTTQLAPTIDDSSSYVADSGNWWDTDLADLSSDVTDLSDGSDSSSDLVASSDLNPVFVAAGVGLLGLLLYQLV